MSTRRVPRQATAERRRPRAPLAIAAVLTAVVTGCSDGTVVIRGTGSIVQERRDLRNTDEIILEGELDVTVRLAPLTGTSDTVIWIEGASDLIDHVETIVAGSSLRVAYRGGVRLDPLPMIEVQCSRLRLVSASGTGTVRLIDLGVGLRPGESCTIEARGTVDIRASGEVESLVLCQMGAADLHFADVVAVEVGHSATGSGDAWINATGHVTTSLTGSGDLIVDGAATIHQTLMGSGQVHRKADH